MTLARRRELQSQAVKSALSLLVGGWVVLCPRPSMAQSPQEQPAPARTIIIDPGHGGKDLGATFGRHYEKDISLAIAKKLEEILLKRGQMSVLLTRNSDENIPLDQRVERSMDSNGRLVVSLHVNKVPNKNVHGIMIYSYGRNPYPFPRRHSGIKPLPKPPVEQIRAGAALAEDVIRSMKASEFSRVSADRADFYLLKNPRIPSILVEMGFISNPKERANLIDPAYQERLAQAIASGLESYLVRRPAVSDPTTAVALNP